MARIAWHHVDTLRQRLRVLARGQSANGSFTLVSKQTGSLRKIPQGVAQGSFVISPDGNHEAYQVAPGGGLFVSVDGVPRSKPGQSEGLGLERGVLGKKHDEIGALQSNEILRFETKIEQHIASAQLGR